LEPANGRSGRNSALMPGLQDGGRLVTTSPSVAKAETASGESGMLPSHPGWMPEQHIDGNREVDIRAQYPGLLT